MLFPTPRAQGRALAVLKAALTQGRVAHAYLFTGPDGVGKSMAATWFAGALFCAGEGVEPCGECPGCRKTLGGMHADLHRLETEGAGRRVRIDAVRLVTKALHMAAYEGGYRVVIIREADRLNEESANALLKTLEEPPERTVIVLVTSLPAVLPDTIRSRCQLTRFVPLPRDLCAELLTARGVDPLDAKVAAALAEGSVGHALELAEFGVLDDRAATLGAVARLDLSRPSELLGMASEWASGADLAGRRTAVSRRLDLLASWYRDLVLMDAGCEVGQLVHSDLIEGLLADGPPAPSISHRCLDRIGEAREALVLNADARLTCERLFVRLAEGGR
jgi:DNA polymerase-3 subunit delta'